MRLRITIPLAYGRDNQVRMRSMDGGRLVGASGSSGGSSPLVFTSVMPPPEGFHPSIPESAWRHRIPDTYHRTEIDNSTRNFLDHR